MNTADITCDKIVSNNQFHIQWYNRVYLCVEKSHSYGDKIVGFDCKKFNSFETADKYFQNKYIQKDIGRHTMIPICRWIPQIFDKYILNKKLLKIYWLGKHTLYRYKSS